jgi:hypothetical protein
MLLAGIFSCKDDDDGPPPQVVISRVEPASAQAGETISIIGNNFNTETGSTALTINDIPAEITSVSRTEIKAIVPEETTSGIIAIIVDGKITRGPVFTIIIPPPTIISISPDSASAGEAVTITGTNFSLLSDSIQVAFNEIAATVNSSSETEIIVTVPEEATSGPVKVTVSGKSVTGPIFTVKPRLPIISNISPSSGIEGTVVTISGANFSDDPTGVLVTFNDIPATITSTTSTEIVAVVPVGATTGPIVISVNGLSVVGPIFTVDASAPSIAAINPESGLVGTTVTITGTNFSPVASENIVTFNGINAPVTSATTTQLITKVPINATTGLITVIVKNKSVSGPIFTVELPVHTIASISPTNGLVGTTVTITGTNFSPVASENIVTFNGVEAKVSSASTTKLVTKVPAGATTGPIVVTIGNNSVTGPEFIVEEAAPTITSISPASGPVGTVVTINGTNFPTNTDEAVVTFNGVAAEITSINATKIVTQVPTGASTGNVAIIVNGKTITGPRFTVVIPPPVITSISPLTGKEGAAVTINGTNFGTRIEDVKIFFNNRQATVLTITPTRITTTVPLGATSGQIRVQVGTQTATGPNFTVEPNIVPFKTVYWTNPNTGEILRGEVNAQGQVSVLVVLNQEDGLISPLGIAFDKQAKKIYWTDIGLLQIMRSNLDGSNIEILFDQSDIDANGLPFLQFPVEIAVTGDKLYWTDQYANQILSGSSNGEGSIQVLYGDDANDQINASYGVALWISGNNLYWTEPSDKQVMQGKLNGSGNPIELFNASDGLESPYGIAIDAMAGKIYIADNSEPTATPTDRILSGNLNGAGTLTTLFDTGKGVDNAVSLTLDLTGKKIYWLNQSETGAILRGNLDGSGNSEVMVDNVNNGGVLTIEQ